MTETDPDNLRISQKRMTDVQAIRRYAKDINNNLRSGGMEHTHRPALRDLLNHLAGGDYAFNEGRTNDAGNPDFVIRMRGVRAGFVECKDVMVRLEAIESDSASLPPSTDNGGQLRRYRDTYRNLLLTNYHELRWFRNGARRGHPVRLLEWDGRARVRVVSETAQIGLQLIRDFLNAGPQPVDNARELAERLAALTRQVRDAIVELFESGRASAYLKQTKVTFENTLLPDLNDRDFADMYAQTLAYGLFVARVNYSSTRRFDRTIASRSIPPSIPFLRRVFDSIAGLDLDVELYAEVVDDMADLFRSANLPSVLRGFGQRTATQDPALHFYETFLAHYDPELREKRGVYYTPAPVVSYIVRSVDHIVRDSFGCPEGLADNTRIDYQTDVMSDSGIRKEKRKAHKVLVLDPACGTGTFLSSIIELVRERVMKRSGQGMWNGYVQTDLLPRLFGFELMMAPYSVAHFNLRMHLQAQEQLFAGANPAWDSATTTTDDRIRIFLTNALEPAMPAKQASMDPFHGTIVSEAEQASLVKTEFPIMVVIGNPPYAGNSANNGDWIKKLMRGDDGTKTVSNYYEIHGAPLNERNPRGISDDYVKFIRFGQWRIEQSGSGVLAYVTNHAWLDNPTFRGMRQSLLTAFDAIYVLDLHGNTRKGELDLEGQPDENVFDIQQGVAISIFVKIQRDGSKPLGNAQVYHAELFGDRNSKYLTLDSSDVSSTSFQRLNPNNPSYLFVPQDTELIEEYEGCRALNDIFNVSWSGITTGRDKFNIHFTKQQLYSTMSKFVSLSPEDARSEFNLKQDTNEWKIDLAQKDLRETGMDESRCVEILYRPFDKRFVYYTGRTRGIMSRPRTELSVHMQSESNIGLITTRGIEYGKDFYQVFCADVPVTQHGVNMKETNHMYPLYLSEKSASAFGNTKQTNLKYDFIEDLSKKWNLEFVNEPTGDFENTFGAMDIFDYLYGMLHSPTYRRRYLGFLRNGFPRIPVPRDLILARGVAGIGSQIKTLHLMGINSNSTLPTFPVDGVDLVRNIRHVAISEDNGGRVFINSSQYFDGIFEDVWDARIGGYKPAQKYLADRKGRILSYDEKEQYMRICGVLADTRELMSAIDVVIDQCGGWPIG